MGSDCFQPEPTFLIGKVDSALLPGAAFFSIATYKSQKIGEVRLRIFAMAESFAL